MEMNIRGLLKYQNAVVMGATGGKKKTENGLEYYPVNKACNWSKQQGEQLLILIMGSSESHGEKTAHGFWHCLVMHTERGTKFKLLRSFDSDFSQLQKV